MDVSSDRHGELRFPQQSKKGQWPCVRVMRLECVGYYPKEVFADGVWDASVDVYSLGMSLVHFLSNAPPSVKMDLLTWRYSECGSSQDIIQAILRVVVKEASDR